MEPAKQSSPYRVQDPRQAATFDHKLRPGLLLACGSEARSLAQLQREFHEPLSKLHYHVERLVGCGLLQVERLEARAGRPVRFYRAVAESFLVSQAAVASPSGQWAKELREALAE